MSVLIVRCRVPNKKSTSYKIVEVYNKVDDQCYAKSYITYTNKQDYYFRLIKISGRKNGSY